jgi:hypothetical protein
LLVAPHSVSATRIPSTFTNGAAAAMVDLWV